MASKKRGNLPKKKETWYKPRLQGSFFSIYSSISLTSMGIEGSTIPKKNIIKIPALQLASMFSGSTS